MAHDEQTAPLSTGQPASLPASLCRRRARKTDPNFFLKRAWYDIGECIKKLIKELDEACARAYGSSKYHIVGEDEADPKAGSISFVSPVARSLMGKAVGEIVGASGQEIEIIAIS